MKGEVPKANMEKKQLKTATVVLLYVMANSVTIRRCARALFLVECCSRVLGCLLTLAMDDFTLVLLTD